MKNKLIQIPKLDWYVQIQKIRIPIPNSYFQIDIIVIHELNHYWQGNPLNIEAGKISTGIFKKTIPAQH